MMLRWTLHDLEGIQDDFTLLVNPDKMDSPFPEMGIEEHAVTIDGEARGVETFAAHGWSFGGVLHEQAQYQAMADWVDRAGRTVLTDHLERAFTVRLLQFDPKRGGTRAHPWRHTYTVNVVTYQIGAPT